MTESLRCPKCDSPSVVLQHEEIALCLDCGCHGQPSAFAEQRCGACEEPYSPTNPRAADGRDLCKACAAFDDVDTMDVTEFATLDEQRADAQLAAYHGDRL